MDLSESEVSILDVDKLEVSRKKISKNYCVGSIRKIRLVNFLTYDDCVISPGPFLNIVYGPNGTGKSSIVCALVLGLGGSPAVLGRAKQVSDYIRHGRHSASIEIDLCATNNATTTVKRQIFHGKKCAFYIDNKQFTMKHVVGFIKANFNIMVDNLCQFLPQDRVSDFSKMSPKELLTACEMCFVNEKCNLFDQHEKLKNLNMEHLGLQKRKKTLSTQIDIFSNKLNYLRKEAQRLENYQNCLFRIGLCKKHISFLEYAESRDRVNQMKTHVCEINEALRNLEEHMKPLTNSIEANASSIDKLNGQLLKTTFVYCKKMQKYAEKFNESDYANFKSEIDQINYEIVNFDSNMSMKNQRINDHRVCLDALNQDMLELKKNFDLQTLGERLSELDLKKKNLTITKTDLQNEILNLRNANSVCLADKKLLLNQLGQSDGIKEQILNHLEGLDRDAARGVRLLKSTYFDHFSKSVYEPPIMNCKLKDLYAAALLESHIGRRDLVSFIVNVNDMKKFISEFKIRQSLNINAAPLNFAEGFNVNQKNKKYATDKYRFVGHLIDFLDAPAHTIKYLIQYFKIDDVPVFKDNLADELIEDLIQNHDIKCFYVGHSKYTVKKSRFTGEKLTTVININKEPKAFFRGNILFDKFKKQDKHLVEKKVEDLDEKMQVNEKKIEQLQNKIMNTDKELTKISSEKGEILKEKSRFDILQAKIKNTTEQIKNFENQKNEDEKKNLLEKKKKIKMHIMKKMQEFCEKILTGEKLKSGIDNFFSVKYKIHSLNIKTNKKKDELAQCHSRKAALKEKLNAAEIVYGKEKDECKQLERAFKEKYSEVDSISDELFDVNTNEPLNSIEKLSGELARLNVEVQGKIIKDDSVLREYNEIVTKHKDLVGQLETVTKEEQETEKVKQNLHAEWFEKLSVLIGNLNEKFRENFKRINCRGEIKLHHRNNEQNYFDYENCGIEIYVSFRKEEENLNRLDSMRQSGGEKSVSTMIFLMTLQHMTQAPMRVIDEINQGMDEANERAVFKMMVELVAELRNSQYFFLSPKALPQLQYSRDITILTIYNGPHVYL